MKRILPLCLVVFILLGYMFPVQPVKADQGTEVTFTNAQLSQIGAWALSNNLITGITDEYDFGNLPIRAPMTPADFLIALGESIVTKNPTPLIEFGYNLEEDIINELKADLNDLWEGAKDFFYELFFGSPQTTLSFDDFIQPSLQFGLDQLNDVLAQEGEGDVPLLPEDYLWFQNINHLYYNDVDFFHFTNFQHYDYSDTHWIPANPLESYSYYLLNVENSSSYGHLPVTQNVPIYINTTGYLPKLIVYYDSSTNTCTYSSSNRTQLLTGGWMSDRFIPPFSNGSIVLDGIVLVQQAYGNPELRDSFEGINSALNWFYQHWFNIDFYVDGQLWVGGNPPSPPVSSGQLTYPNGEPAVREFPIGTQIDWDELYNRIYQAIVDGLVFDFSDIDDCIVDVNGQSAVASLRLVRTDYDKLYIEQYGNDITLPYFPKTLTTGEAQAVVGGTVGNIISPYNPSNPALNEDSVIPSDIARVLYIGVFLTLFACIINRLLE